MHRFLFFATMIAVALTALAIPAMRSAAQQGGEYVPDTQTITPGPLRQSLSAGPYELAPVAAPKPFSYLLLRYTAHVPAGATMKLEARASTDGQSWSGWMAVEPNDDLWTEADGPDVVWSQIFDVGALARYWQVRVTASPAADGTDPELRQVEGHTVDTTSGPASPTPDAPGPQPQAIERNAAPRPGVVSRTNWGSPDGQGSREPPDYYRVNHLVVHHTADSGSLYASEPNWAARVRAIWSYHAITRGWGDIGYNYLIDPNGVIYEGRAGGDDAVAFHDTANYGSMGVAMIGTYQNGAPSGATQDALVKLLAWKAAQRGIDPQGSSWYYGCTVSSYCKPYNSNGVVVNIAGHRQVTPGHTTCPGDATMALMPSIRERVRQLIVASEQPTAKVDLVGVQIPRTTIAAGELLEVRFTVRNTGQVVVSGQAPVSDAGNPSGAYVYREGECFNGDPAGATPQFPKESGRVRVVLGTPAWDAEHPGSCNGATSNYPWRWGLSGELRPGEERAVVGYVLFSRPGSYTLQAGIVQEYVGYLAQNISPTMISVTNERGVPEAAVYDQQLRPLAHIFQLGAAPDSLLGRLGDPGALPRGAYVGSLAWMGEPLNWGVGGPFGLSDRFVTVQTRSFMADVAGAYTFRITSDDGAWLLVDGQVVASTPGLHPAQSGTGVIQLGSGPHTIAVVGFEATGEAWLAYDYQPPGAAGFTTVPDTIASLPHTGGSFDQPPPIALGADDLGGSGVMAVRWSLNGGEWQESYGALLRIGRLQQGSYSVRYFPIDAAGNQGAIHELRFGVAAPPPPPTEGRYKAYLPGVRR